MNDLDKIILEKLEVIQSDITELKVNQAVHEVRIGRSSAFFGAISGMVVAILTAVIINFVANPNELQPKVMYKDKSPKVELENE